MAGTAEEAGQGQDRVRLRVGFISMETDSIWSLQCHRNISAIDGTRTNRCDDEVRQSGNMLSG